MATSQPQGPEYETGKVHYFGQTSLLLNTALVTLRRALLCSGFRARSRNAKSTWLSPWTELEDFLAVTVFLATAILLARGENCGVLTEAMDCPGGLCGDFFRFPELDRRLVRDTLEDRESTLSRTDPVV